MKIYESGKTKCYSTNNREGQQGEHAKEEGGERVAEEEQEEGVCCQETSDGGASGEAYVDSESIKGEGRDAPLRRDQVGQERAHGGTIHLCCQRLHAAVAPLEFLPWYGWSPHIAYMATSIAATCSLGAVHQASFSLVKG